MAYTYTDGQGLAVLDKTTPNGATEPVSILDDAIRQIKAFMRDATTSGLQGLFNRVATAETNITNLQAANIPVGVMMAYGAPSAPSGWLVCDGSAVSRTTYSTLFALIGIVYGSGNGTTTFNLPDFRGRVAVMNDGGAGRAPGVAAGTFGGEATHTITIPEMPAHTHGPGSGTNFQNMTAGGSQTGGGAGNTESYSTTTGSTGGGTPMNIMQPFLGVSTIIIKY